MRLTTEKQELDQLAFAQDAARMFSKHPEFTTFGNIAPGEFLALRWGIGGDCVLVVKLDEFHEPTNYTGLIKKT